jgi:hypothetical protein
MGKLISPSDADEITDLALQIIGDDGVSPDQASIQAVTTFIERAQAQVDEIQALMARPVEDAAPEPVAEDAPLMSRGQDDVDPENPSILRSRGQGPYIAGQGKTAPAPIDFFPRIPRLSERGGLEGVIRTYEGAAELLMRAPGLENLGKAIRTYFDRSQQLGGEVAKILEAPMQAAFGTKVKLKALLADPMQALRDRGIKVEAEKEFERWAAVWDRGSKPGQPTARRIYDAASPEAKGLIDAWMQLAKMTGDKLQAAGVEVFDAKLGAWRPIGRAKRFFPRVLRPEFEQAMRDPAANPEAWAELVQVLLKEGVIADASEAGKYITTQRARPHQMAGDYFAGVEMARTEGLPESLYDHRFARAVEYLARWGDRLAQIEAFGQKHKDGDLFDKAQAGIVDAGTRDYLNTLAEVIYGTGVKSMDRKVMAVLNQLATGLMLGNPGTATLNVIGGLTLNNMAYGRDAIKAYAQLRNFSEHVNVAKKLGIINDDYLRLIHDTDGLTPEWLSQGVSFLMKIGGYTPTERLIRIHAMLSSQNKLDRALGLWANGFGSAAARREAAWFVRNGFDPYALLAESSQVSEDGQRTGTEINRFLRYGVNLTQGSYKVDQVPLWVDTPTGRFLFKYWKFSNQLSRMFMKNHMEPFLKAIGPGETVKVKNPLTGKMEATPVPRSQALMPMVRYFGFAAVGGVVATVRGALFGYTLGGPDDDELEKALQDGDTAKAVALGMGIAFEAVLAMGGIGVLQNPAQWMRDFQNRGRAYDPTDPPGISILKETVALGRRGLDQGKITAQDVQDYADRVSSLVRTARRATMYGLGKAGSEMEAARLEVIRRERGYARKMTGRYAKEQELRGKTYAPGAFGATENTPINRAVVDALFLGEPGRAQAILKAHLDGIDTVRGVDSAILSAKSAVRGRQPLMVSAAPTNAERRAFIAWARENMTEDGLRRLELLDTTYRRSAQTAGLMPKDSEKKDAREDQRRELRQGKLTDAERQAIYRKLGLALD